MEVGLVSHLSDAKNTNRKPDDGCYRVRWKALRPGPAAGGRVRDPGAATKPHGGSRTEEEVLERLMRSKNRKLHRNAGGPPQSSA